MEHISLILSDLDGTLFRDDKSVSNHTKETIIKVQQKGILFGISTSRALVNAVKFLDGINPDVVISNGGALAFHHTKETIILLKSPAHTGSRCALQGPCCRFAG